MQTFVLISYGKIRNFYLCTGSRINKISRFLKKRFTNALFFSIIFNMVCACSSVDRALASGARCVGSIPIRRICKKCFTARRSGAFFIIDNQNTCRTRKHVITQHYNLYETLEAMIYENEGKLTENEINLLYSNLFEYTQADERTKREHASNAYLSKM